VSWEPEPDHYLRHTFPSPDGSLRVEDWEGPNERGPAYRSLRILDAATGEILAVIGSAACTHPPHFLRLDEVLLQFDYGGVPIALTIHARAGTFALHADANPEVPAGPAEPLVLLHQRLAERRPRYGALALPQEVTLREVLLEGCMLCGALLMTVAALIVLVFLAASPRERWIATGGVLLFGAGAVWSLADLRRMRLRRKGGPAGPSKGDSHDW